MKALLPVAVGMVLCLAAVGYALRHDATTATASRKQLCVEIENLKAQERKTAQATIRLLPTLTQYQHNPVNLARAILIQHVKIHAFPARRC